MEILVILISISVFIAGAFLVFFLWSMKSGQYDDIYSPSVRILFDDKPSKTKSEIIPKSKDKKTPDINQ